MLKDQKKESFAVPVALSLTDYFIEHFACTTVSRKYVLFTEGNKYTIKVKPKSVSTIRTLRINILFPLKTMKTHNQNYHSNYKPIVAYILKVVDYESVVISNLISRWRLHEISPDRQ